MSSKSMGGDGLSKKNGCDVDRVPDFGATWLNQTTVTVRGVMWMAYKLLRVCFALTGETL